MKVLLVEDHALFRDGVTLILQQLAGDVQVLSAATAAQALATAQASPDTGLVLLDYNLPDVAGFECLLRIAQLLPTTPIIMLSAEQDSALIQQALAFGARGFITKASSAKVMLSAIQLVLAGGIYVPVEMLTPSAGKTSQTAMQVDEPNTAVREEKITTGKHALTDRQMDVLREMIQGRSNKEIARILNMSPSTAKVHVAAILREFDVKNRTQAVNYAQQYVKLD